MLIAIGRAHAREGRAADLLAVATTVTSASRGDDGCVDYGFFTDPADPGALVSVEVWRDRAALDAHMGHDHTHAFLAAVPELVAGQPTMAFYDATPIDLADLADPADPAATSTTGATR